MAPVGEWRLVRDAARPGPLQMALDEVAARTAAAGGPRTVRVYSWAPSTLSMGYTQAAETVDWAFCDREGIAVTRRQTGGGGIYHDRYGDVSYAVVAPAEESPGELLAAYHELLEPVLDAFERLGLAVDYVESARPAVYEPACYLRGLHPAHDLVVDGRKISGNAQYRQRDAVIQHGSLTYARETARHLGVFADPPDAETFESRVTSIREQTGHDRERVVETLESALADWCDAEPTGFTDAELAEARELADRKYAADGWVRERVAPQAIRRAGDEAALTPTPGGPRMLIGAHVSVAGGVHNAVDRQLEIGGNCGQIFTTSPQVWAHPDIGDEEADAFRRETAAELEGPWLIHSSYLVNLCTPKPDLREQSVASLQAEVDAAERLGVPYVNVHLGAHTGAGVEAGLDNAAGALESLEMPERVSVLIESDAGAGTKLGGDFDHLAGVIDRCDLDLDVCLDTAHLFAAGYDLSTESAVDETVAAFDDAVGLGHLRCIHLNDSKHGCGTHKDEHAHVGEGEIGVEGMRAVVNHPALRDCPFVLETPTEGGKSYAWNVDRVRELRAG